MLRTELVSQIFKKQSYLCVGLDTDVDKIPKHLLKESNPVLAFNKAIIDATKDYCVSYKINTAFYEVMGSKGWDIMQETFDYIPNTHFKIADAKRGDIGNTSHQYAKAFFETMNVDAITVAPYMGEDSIRPFLEYTGKWTIVLGLTSNKGSNDFQRLKLGNETGFVYEKVLEKIAGWGTIDNLMFVTGATQAPEFSSIRKIIPDHFLLVPGVGAQGGSLADVSKYGLNKDCGLLVNASRAVIYASVSSDFCEAAASISKAYQQEMSSFL
jgi:orotidine-5'-phosphate decarboxylase